MIEYGVDNFKIEVIEKCSPDELNTREQFWIQQLNSRDPNVGYNICKGGEAGPGGPRFAGHHHSVETRRQMSKNRRGSNNSNYGNHWKQSAELKLLHSKLSSGSNNGMYGKKHSDESRDKNRQKHLGKKAYSNIELNDVKMLSEEQIPQYVQLGYKPGNIHTHYKNSQH